MRLELSNRTTAPDPPLWRQQVRDRRRPSNDGGRTWGGEIDLRSNGGGRDVGYPRTVQRPDGKIVTVYYFHDQAASNRYIAATIWDPGSALD